MKMLGNAAMIIVKVTKVASEGLSVMKIGVNARIMWLVVLLETIVINAKLKHFLSHNKVENVVFLHVVMIQNVLKIWFVINDLV